MSVTFPGTITGAPQTGFTSPTYTTTSDLFPGNNGKQCAITGIGGTQAGVLTHSVSRPFTLTVTRPSVNAVLGKPHPVTGLIAQFPRNKTTLLTRHGVVVLAGQPIQMMLIRTEIEVPAGSDVADPANLRAALSAHAGLLWNQSSGFGDTLVDGILGN